MSRVYVDTYHDDDILYGKGGFTNRHPPNKCLREIIRGYFESHRNSGDTRKKNLTLKVLEEITNLFPRGRFLQYDRITSRWYLLDWSKVREKIAARFRDEARARLRQTRMDQQLPTVIVQEGQQQDDDNGTYSGSSVSDYYKSSDFRSFVRNEDSEQYRDSNSLDKSVLVNNNFESHIWPPFPGLDLDDASGRAVDIDKTSLTLNSHEEWETDLYQDAASLGTIDIDKTSLTLSSHEEWEIAFDD